MHVVATAGHVDHGKSTLIKALTGTDPDRLAEEKSRGLTIDLGFADTVLASGRGIAFIDVPGHVRFLKNMLAGVGGVDACLFVVAATEGWKPQSEEHLRILELLDFRHGVIALTMMDQVDEELAELARLDVAERVEGTFLESATVVEVAAPAGIGLDDLRVALDDLTASTPTALNHGRPRLWIDRSFAAKGAGTVVTGTLTGGAVTADQALLALPQRRKVRVRALQTLHRQVDEVGPGNRLAINLMDIDHDELGRGDALVNAGQWHETSLVDASLHVLADLGHEVSRRGAYAAYVGSGEHAVKLRVLGADRIRPGHEGSVRLYLPISLPLLPGDRYILRESGRGETVGGGEILDVDPTLPASRARPDRSVDRVVAERGWVTTTDLLLLTGREVEPSLGQWVVDPAALREARDTQLEAVRSGGPLGLDIAALDERDRAVLEVLGNDGDIEIEAGRATVAGASDPLADHPYPAQLGASLFTPPPPDGVDAGELRELVRRGDVMVAEGIHFAPDALDEAARIVARLLQETPDGVTVSQIREGMTTSRKYAMPLISQLDATGVTRRRDNVRIAGPRLPEV
jgi:selenocysteine-specific elongation factor